MYTDCLPVLLMQSCYPNTYCICMVRATVYTVQQISSMLIETGFGHPGHLGQLGHILSKSSRFKNYLGLTRIGSHATQN